GVLAVGIAARTILDAQSHPTEDRTERMAVLGLVAAPFSTPAFTKVAAQPWIARMGLARPLSRLGVGIAVGAGAVILALTGAQLLDAPRSIAHRPAPASATSLLSQAVFLLTLPADSLTAGIGAAIAMALGELTTALDEHAERTQLRETMKALSGEIASLEPF